MDEAILKVKTCKKCGALFSGVRCMECRKLATLAYRTANKEKLSVANAAWYASNPAKLKQYVAKYRAKVPEKVKARANAYYEANSEKINARTSAYKKDNPEKRRVHVENRRARKGGGKLSIGITDKLLKLQKGKCACCGKPLVGKYHLDHILPLALGGANEDGNIQLLTARCNTQKSAKHPIDFMQSRGFLL